MKAFIYIVVAVITLSTVFRQFSAERIDSEFDKQGFSELPVQVGGRIKPLDSVARNTLLILSGKQTVTGVLNCNERPQLPALKKNPKKCT